MFLAGLAFRDGLVSMDSATDAFLARPQLHLELCASCVLPAQSVQTGCIAMSVPRFIAPFLHQIAQSASSARLVTSAQQGCATSAIMASSQMMVVVSVNPVHLALLG